MYLRSLIYLILIFCMSVNAQVPISQGTNFSVDVAKDGRLAIDLRGNIWIVPSNGGKSWQLTQNLKSAKRPRWSPNNKQLAYSDVIDGRQGIWLIEVDTGQTKSLSLNSQMDIYPTWHPDAQRVLYSSDTNDDGYDLWEIDISSGLRWQVSNLPGDEIEGAWSHDGRDLIYVHHQDGQWSLMLRRHAQPDETLLSTKNKIAAPTWRPDGSLITFFETNATSTSIKMVILSQPRLVRMYASNEQFFASPIKWLDRQRMIYTADGQIKQRLFNSRSSNPLYFQTTIYPDINKIDQRERPKLQWFDEPRGQLVIRAARLFDGITPGYQYKKDILISGGRIKAIEEYKNWPTLIVIDMGDLTILPGLIDADALLPEKLSSSDGPDLLTMGITTIVGSHPDHNQLNKLWAGKEIPGPRFLNAEKWQMLLTLKSEIDVTAAVITSKEVELLSGKALAKQIRAMQIAGLTPEQTFRGMGINAAAAVQADPYLGRIATGTAADFIFVDGDPLADVMNVLNVLAVLRNGRLYSISGLNDRAKNVE